MLGLSHTAKGRPLFYFAFTNAALIAFPVDGLDLRRVESRSAFMTVINMIPLFPYGHSVSLFKVLNSDRCTHANFHRFIGVIALVEAILHASIVLVLKPKLGYCKLYIHVLKVFATTNKVFCRNNSHPCYCGVLRSLYQTCLALFHSPHCTCFNLYWRLALAYHCTARTETIIDCRSNICWNMVHCYSLW